MGKKQKLSSNRSALIIALVSFAATFLLVWLIFSQFQTQILQLIIGS